MSQQLHHLELFKQEKKKTYENHIKCKTAARNIHVDILAAIIHLLNNGVCDLN